MSLDGKTVAITRPIEQAEDLADLVTSRKGIPYVASTVEIQPVKQSPKIQEFLNLMSEGRIGLVVFMSQNAVSSLFDASSNMGLKSDLLAELKKVAIMAIGPKTQKTLETYGLTSSVTPSDHSSDGIIGEIAKLALKGKEVAVPRTDKASDYLKNELGKKSIKVIEFTVYQTALPKNPAKVLKLLEDLLNGQVDVITFTSSSTVQNFFRIAQEHHLVDQVRRALNDRIVVVSIGPVTQKTLEDFDVNVDVVPRVYTIEQMMAALDDYSNQGNNFENLLDLTDRKLLQTLQDHFPLVENPLKKVGNMLGVSEAEVLNRSRKLLEQGIIQQVGPILDTQKVQPSVSTLIGLKVPEEKIAEVANILNQYDNVSHNYLRENEHNVWFTLTAPTSNKIAETLKEITQKAQLEEDAVLNLPTKQRFKIDVRFQFVNKLQQGEAKNDA